MNIIEKLQGMGLNIMPLRHKGSPHSKLPHLPKWKYLQSEKYTGEFPLDHNIGVICGNISDNLLVVDLDHESLYSEFSEYHDKTFIVKTGKKGYHIYFKYSEIIVESKKLFDATRREIDLKAEGGYVVAPESVHPHTQKQYEIICDKPIMTVDLVELQAKLQKLGFNPENKTIKEIEKGIKVGDRNDATFKYVCYLVRKHQLHGAALRAEVEKLNNRHIPPLSSSELDIIIASALKYEAHNIKTSKGLDTFSELKKEIRDYLEEEPEIIDLSKFQKYTRLFKRDTISNLFNEIAGYECKFEYSKTALLEDIDTELENVPIQFEAMIIAAGERFTYTKEADFICPSCDASIHKKCNQFYIMIPPKCPDCKVPCSINYNSRVTKYIQQIRIQEFLENTQSNAPTEFDAEILDNNVGKAFIGDRKTFVGKFRSIPPSKGGYNIIVFEILEMYDMDQKAGCLPSEEELEKWKQDPDIYNKVVSSIAPELYLRPELKESCMLSMAGGSSLNGKRERIHIAMIGDAQLGKSELLLAINEILVGSAYAVGTNASKAGLSISMVKLYNGTMVPRAGLLPAHTGGFVCLDEVDKMKPEDREGILESMEQGTSSQSKGGSNYSGITLPAETTIIAAGNPKNGKFNPSYNNIMDNFNLETPFVTRFDILWLLIDSKDEEEDEIIRDHIRNFKNMGDNYIKLEELQRYFSYVRTINVTISEELDIKINNIHKELRQISDLNELEVGWRLFYGLYRLVSAYTRLHLRTEATVKDVEAVKKILMASIDSLKINGKVKMKTKKQTKSDVFLTIWNSCSDENDTVNKNEFIAELSKKEPFNAISAGVEFEKYKTSGEIELVNITQRYKFANNT